MKTTLSSALIAGFAIITSAAAYAQQGGVQSDGKIQITKLDPSPREELREGERVRLTVSVDFAYPSDRATILLYVQEPAPSSAMIASTQREVNTPIGSTSLTVEFVVPNTKTVMVFVPLHVRPDKPTSVADFRVYEVRPR
jgi:hypothetical protein